MGGVNYKREKVFYPYQKGTFLNLEFGGVERKVEGTRRSIRGEIACNL